MAGSMDELDNRIMALGWRYESRSDAETSCRPTSFWRRDVRNSRCRQTHGYDVLNMRNVFRKIHRREGDVAEEGQWRRVVELRLQFIIAL